MTRKSKILGGIAFFASLSLLIAVFAAVDIAHSKNASANECVNGKLNADGSIPTECKDKVLMIQDDNSFVVLKSYAELHPNTPNTDIGDGIDLKHYYETDFNSPNFQREPTLEDGSQGGSIYHKNDDGTLEYQGTIGDDARTNTLGETILPVNPFADPAEIVKNLENERLAEGQSPRRVGGEPTVKGAAFGKCEGAVADFKWNRKPETDCFLISGLSSTTGEWTHMNDIETWENYNALVFFTTENGSGDNYRLSLPKNNLWRNPYSNTLLGTRVELF